MEFDDEERPLGDFGSLLGVPAGDSEETGLEEELDVSTGVKQRAWLVKLPHFLCERWSSIQTPGQELGRVRVYQSANPDVQDISVLLPDAVANAPPGADESQRIPNEYKLMMQNAQSENLYVFAERNHEKDTVAPTPEASGSNAPTPSSSGAAAPRGKKRPREPTLTAAVLHECNLTPDVTSPAYSMIMRQRQHLATQPKRVLEKLGGTQAEQNRLVGGAVDYSKNPKRDNLFIKNARRPGQAREKMVRLPANEVRDMIFSAFDEFDYWTVKSLKERTKQPETYLRDLLQEIAQQNGAGPYQGLYSLLPAFKRQKTDGEASESAGPGAEETDNMQSGLGSDDDRKPT